VKSKYRKLKLGRGRTIDEHRHVMQRAVGRSLASTEVVHHINGDTHDNRLENLQVMPIAEHARLHAIKKLTEAAVIEIRASKKSQRWLAAFYGVHPKAIWTAKHGKTWGHISTPQIKAETSNMKYVTTAMIARHAGRHQESVARALKLTKTPVVWTPGVKGLRVELGDANRFLALQWPETGPMKQERTMEEVR
jgi:hypothetical protein